MDRQLKKDAEKVVDKKKLKEMANRIKERRKSFKYTQEQFAEMINLSTNSYTRIENAFQKPSLDTLIRISENLKVSLDYLVFGEDGNFANSPTDTELLTALLDYSNSDKLKHVAEILNKLIKIKEE